MLSVSIVFSPVLSLAQSTIPPAGTKYDANGDIIYSSAPVVATTTDAIFSYERGLQAGYDRQQTVRIWRSQSVELEQKISTLNEVATSSVSMPILFGVVLSDFCPNFGVSRGGGY